MKKLIGILLAAAMLLSLSACGSSNAGETTANNNPDAVVENDSLTAPLQFASGSDEAYCPVCKKTVTWMALTQAYVDTIEVTNPDGSLIDSAIMSGKVFESGHYYLAEDLAYYDSPIMGFFRGPGNGQTTCLHLNDHNIDTPATTSIFGNSGVLNVMGNGVVTGYSPNHSEGAAVRHGNRNAKNAVNLYGGTYKKTELTGVNSPVVAFDGAGRMVSVFEGVVIDGGEGVAVFADSSAAREKEGYLTLKGCTVYGDVKLANYDTYATNVDITDASVSGKVIIPTGHTLKLSGKVEITKLSTGESVKVKLEALTAGTSIGIDAAGVFTAETEKAADYVAYFLPVDAAKKVVVKENALSCE